MEGYKLCLLLAVICSCTKSLAPENEKKSLAIWFWIFFFTFLCLVVGEWT